MLLSMHCCILELIASTSASGTASAPLDPIDITATSAQGHTLGVSDDNAEKKKADPFVGRRPTSAPSTISENQFTTKSSRQAILATKARHTTSVFTIVTSHKTVSTTKNPSATGNGSENTVAIVEDVRGVNASLVTKRLPSTDRDVTG